MKIQSLAERALREGNVAVVDEVVQNAAPARYGALPEKLHPAVRNALERLYPKGLYSHQSEGISEGLEGKNICVCTNTASGKTRIFTSISTSHLLFTPDSAVLALYPLRALLQDQAIKWREAAADVGLDSRLVQIIDGSIPMKERIPRLQRGRIVLMTPDVLHAWLLPSIGEQETASFLRRLSIVVLDEAHIYDGVFGSNMAYLMRRLRSAAGAVPGAESASETAGKQFLASTATMSDGENFMRSLTGVDFHYIGPERDGTPTFEKRIVHCSISSAGDGYLSFLRKIGRDVSNSAGNERFLIFTDSRKRVEELASDLQRSVRGEKEEKNEENAREPLEEIEALIANEIILPYRAGYEDNCREKIQEALTQAKLKGVVSTSALELGIDIGNIGLVILIGAPADARSFWQRAGRTGRDCPGLVIILDIDDFVYRTGLRGYLARDFRPNTLYLDNEYLRYANVLCAAEEQRRVTSANCSEAPFSDLNKVFLRLLHNELNPAFPVPQDLYPLKQQAANGPHHAFPLRACAEKNYVLSLGHGWSGSLSYSQLLREGYPGAVYRHLAQAFRVNRIYHGPGEIVVRKSRTIARTTPKIQKAVFPLFQAIHRMLRSKIFFVCESELQVAERVTGFRETVGRNLVRDETYGMESPFSQYPLNRFIRTSGVSFLFPGTQEKSGAGRYVCDAFCSVCQVREGDADWGIFAGKGENFGGGEMRGFSVYDSTYGSLRLTKQILPRLDDILKEAIRLAEKKEASLVVETLERMKEMFPSLEEHSPQRYGAEARQPATGEENGWLPMVAPGEKAMLHDGVSHIYEEVRVLSFVYSPKGMLYSLDPGKNGGRWIVPREIIRPFPGGPQVLYNIETGEILEGKRPGAAEEIADEKEVFCA
jgi:DEAD/DEAH box helicase domain-containing protein